MTDVIATIRIMPVDIDVDLRIIEGEAVDVITRAGGEVGKTEIEPVAFGLKALKLIFAIDEKKGSLDPVEDEIKEIEGVNSAEVIDIRRALG